MYISGNEINIIVKSINVLKIIVQVRMNGDKPHKSAKTILCQNR